MDSQDRQSSSAMVEIAPKIHVAASALRFSYTRSSGPGGQHVNKVATKTRLHVRLDELKKHLSEQAIEKLIKSAGSRVTKRGFLVLTASKTRSVRSNRQACRDRLRALILEAIKPVLWRKPRHISRISREKRLEEKRRQAMLKQRRKRPYRDEQ